MTEPLFRPEALQARRRSWLGDISLAQPLPLWLLTAFAVAGAAAVVLLLAFGEYTRRSRVLGQLVPDLGLATVVAPVDGVVTRPVPREEVRVERGQPLVVIATPRATTQTGDMTAGLLRGLQKRRIALQESFESKTERLKVQTAGFAQQLKMAEREQAQLESALGIQQQSVELAERLLAHYRKLAARHYVSQVALTEAAQASLAQAANLETLRRQATAIERSIVQIRQSLREAPAERSALAADKTRALAELDQERLRIQASGEVLVKAPVDGLVASRLIERGQTVHAGQPLLSLLPAGSTLQAQLLLPSRAIGFIQPGDPVVLRYPAFPHQKFGHYRGTVRRISRSALSPEGLGALIGNVRAGEPYYRIVVDLAAQSVVAYGKREPLRPGMLVEADIPGERRKLYEWLLEPLYSLSGRL